MQALVLQPDQPERVQFDPHYPDPGDPPAGEVRICVRRAGVCSTDLELARGYMGFAGIPGHEFVGEVVAGDARLSGHRVVAEINCSDPAQNITDPELRKHDPRRTVLGIAGRDGAFAEFLHVPAQNCHVVPASIDDDTAVFVEPVAAAVQVLRDRPIAADERVAVLGSGRLGLLIAQVVALHNPGLTVIGRNPRTLKLAESLGLKTLPVDAVTPNADHDVVIEATGAPAGLALAQQLVRPRGTIVLKSTFAGGSDIDLAPLVIHEIRVIGSRCGPFDAALELLAAGRIRVKPLITARFPLAQGAEAFAAAAKPEHVKVLIDVGASA